MRAHPSGFSIGNQPFIQNKDRERQLFVQKLFTIQGRRVCTPLPCNAIHITWHGQARQGEARKHNFH